MKLIFAQVVDTAAITALIAANPIAASILGVGALVLIYTYRANFKSLIDNKTWTPPVSDHTAVAVTTVPGSAPTTVSTTVKNTVLSSLSNFIDQVHSLPIVQQLDISRDSIVCMFLGAMIRILSDWFRNTTSLTDEQKTDALGHLSALSPMISVGGPIVAPPTPGPAPGPATAPVLQSRKVL